MSYTRTFQKLDDRLAGLPVDQALHEGVTEWLEPALRRWLMLALTDDVAQRVALNMRMKVSGIVFTSELVRVPTHDLLNVVDATLQLHSGWDAPNEFLGGTLEGFDSVLSQLEQIFLDARSLYRIDRTGRCLVRRVDETVQEAADATLKAAPATAAGNLHAAWLAAYGMKPEPDKVFNEAIRAVEEVACPLVEPKKAAAGKATLGSVIGELRNSWHRWELALPGTDGQPRGVESLVGKMETLWEAQRSRHGGGNNSRRQTQEEAEAAVHLAVLLVQWLSSGVLRKKP